MLVITFVATLESCSRCQECDYTYINYEVITTPDGQEIIADTILRSFNGVGIQDKVCGDDDELDAQEQAYADSMQGFSPDAEASYECREAAK